MSDRSARATDPVAAGLDRFLRRVDLHALRHAELATGNRRKSLRLVHRAMGDFLRDSRQATPERWPLLFWRALGRHLARATAGAGDGGAGVSGARAGAALALDAGAAGPVDVQDDRRALESLQSGLRALPRDQRGTFLLRVWEGLDIESTARAMELSEADAKAALFHALQALRAPETAEPGAGSTHDWVLRARALLEADARRVDADTRAQLAHARAVAGRRHAQRAGRLRLLAGLAVLVVVAVLALQLAPRRRAGSVGGGSAVPAATMRAPAAAPLSAAQRAIASPDYSLLAEDPDADLLQDLEFYVWLAERQHSDG